MTTFEGIKFAKTLDGIHEIDPKIVARRMNPIVRLKCLHCGLARRKPGCVHGVPRFIEAKKKILSMEKGYVFVWKNDGTRIWKDDPKDMGNIQLKIRKGRQLKGAEAGMSRYIQRKMREISIYFLRQGYETMPFATGPCNAGCGKGRCPKKTSDLCTAACAALIPSLESWYILVYELNNKLKVKWEYPVINCLTLTSMILVRRIK